MLEPYEAFDIFCREYGYQDVVECVPEEVDLVRLHQALDDYEQYCKCQGCQEDQCASDSASLAPIHLHCEEDTPLLSSKQTRY